MSLKLAFEGPSAFGRMPGSPTIEDMLIEIRKDPALTVGQKLALTAQLGNVAGSLPRSTPLGAIGSAMLGAVLSNLVAKYFGMGIIGRTVATVAGFGLGSSIYSHIHDNGIPGWDAV